MKLEDSHIRQLREIMNTSPLRFIHVYHKRTYQMLDIFPEDTLEGRLIKHREGYVITQPAPFPFAVARDIFPNDGGEYKVLGSWVNQGSHEYQILVTPGGIFRAFPLFGDLKSHSEKTLDGLLSSLKRQYNA